MNTKGITEIIAPQLQANINLYVQQQFSFQKQSR